MPTVCFPGELILSSFQLGVDVRELLLDERIFDFEDSLSGVVVPVDSQVKVDDVLPQSVADRVDMSCCRRNLFQFGDLKELDLLQDCHQLNQEPTNMKHIL